jgi:hypothetical protein
MMFGPKIKVDKDLMAKLEKYAGLAGYSSAEEFVKHVLEREIAKFEEGGDSEDEIRKRMQGLGYIS